VEIIRLGCPGSCSPAPAPLPPAVLCLGNFDGVHTGHAALLNEALKIKRRLAAQYNDIVAGVLTFSPSPNEVLLASPPPRITDLKEKAGLIAEAGMDRLYIVDFEYVRDMTPGRFISEILKVRCGCVHAVCGFNFRFGIGGYGGPDTLDREFCGNVSVLGPVMYSGVAVSSTGIRHAVLAGEMEAAAAMLGRPYSLTAPVVRGSSVGGRLGFPTANQKFPPGKLIPKIGVYISACVVDGVRRPAVTDIGVRPTFCGQDELRCETHIIGYDAELYGRTIKTEFYKYLRPEYRFESPDELAAAVRADIESALEYFEKANIF
jgi:riboflavin kinase/FMN adenylyltransferase